MPIIRQNQRRSEGLGRLLWAFSRDAKTRVVAVLRCTPPELWHDHSASNRQGIILEEHKYPQRPMNILIQNWYNFCQKRNDWKCPTYMFKGHALCIRTLTLRHFTQSFTKESLWCPIYSKHNFCWIIHKWRSIERININFKTISYYFGKIGWSSSFYSFLRLCILYLLFSIKYL